MSGPISARQSGENRCSPVKKLVSNLSESRRLFLLAANSDCSPLLRAELKQYAMQRASFANAVMSLAVEEVGSDLASENVANQCPNSIARPFGEMLDCCIHSELALSRHYELLRVTTAQPERLIFQTQQAAVERVLDRLRVLAARVGTE